MTPSTNPGSSFHLTDEQIDDFLIGDLAVEAAAHLDACDPCLSRVAAAEEPLASFRAVTLAWSERRSATLPLQVSSLGEPSWTRRLAWSAAAAVALAIGLTVPAMHRDARPEAAVTVPVTQSATAGGNEQIASNEQVASDQQIARDNQMLRAIDRELDASVESPAAFGLPADSHVRGHARAAVRD